MGKQTAVRVASAEAIAKVIELWCVEAAKRHPGELRDATLAYEVGQLGRLPQGGDDVRELEGLRSSLPAVWSSFFRVRHDGETALAEAKLWKKLSAPALQTALGAFERARVLFANVVAVRGDGTVVADDVLLGRQVEITPPVGYWRLVSKGLRVFAPVVDRGDGRFVTTSLVIGNPMYASVSPELLMAALRDHLAAHAPGEIGFDEGDVAGTLLRLMGVAAGVLRRTGQVLELHRRMNDPLWAERDAIVEALRAGEQVSAADIKVVAPSADEQEALLARAEMAGRAGATPAWLDLDPLRRELGIVGVG